MNSFAQFSKIQYIFEVRVCMSTKVLNSWVLRKYCRANNIHIVVFKASTGAKTQIRYCVMVQKNVETIY